MIFRQYILDSVSAASYLIGCIAQGEAIVVDPSLAAEHYVTAAAEKGLRIVAVAETHMHADYYSTARAIQALTGATIYAPRIADVRFAHQAIDDGSEIRIGNLIIRAVHTPGHTPEHMSYTVTDTPRATEPWFVLTGDSLFVGDVGRVDLVSIAGTGTDIQYTSMQRLLALPDHVEVFPGHIGGSACGGRAMSGKASSTIGFERRYNWALQAPDQQTFTEWMQQDVREVVEGILTHRNTNRGELPLPAGYYGDHGVAVPVAELVAAQAAGAVLIDVRPAAQFHTGFLANAVNIPYSVDTLIARVMALVPTATPVVLYADTMVTGAAAKQLITGAGYTVVAVSSAPLAQVETLPAIDIAGLHAKVNDGATILDVREPFEHAKGSIPGALHIPLLTLAGAALPAAPLVIVCESGQRATVAASYLRQRGVAVDALVYPGGMSDYLARYAVVHA
ncbi:MAG: hypothetical protein RLZZ297_995 [Chloroflexota bacterium]|jgi:hydroxyacylglutathione hydrolase